MGSSSDAFDSLCQQVFMAIPDSAHQTSTLPSKEETALSLLSQAQVYELPSSYALPSKPTSRTESTGAPSSAIQDRTYYRIHLENIEDPLLQALVQDILVHAIDSSALLELPFDRNLSGYSSRTRTEAREAPLEAAVVLDMMDLSSEEEAPASPPITDNQGATNSSSDSNSGATNKTMLLVPTGSWIRMTSRIRYWRAESHRIKAAEREVILDRLLDERWKVVTSHHSPTAISSPPPSSGSLVSSTIPPTSLPPSPALTPSPSTASSPRPTSALQAPIPLTRSSPYKQPFQEHQLDSLVQFMLIYGDEPSAASILRGLLDLIRRQLTERKVLLWTFDRANMTEQKPEVTVAFLDLVARLGLELLTTDRDQDCSQRPPLPAESNSLSSSTSNLTIAAPPQALGKSSKPNSSSTDLRWTFGSKMDDHRLEYWIHHLQQASLPVLKMDDQSLLPSTASFIATADHPLSTATASQNPIPVTTRRRFLQGHITIPAGAIQILATTTTSSSSALDVPTAAVIRERSFVLTKSKYALLASSSGETGSSAPILFVNRFKKDVKDLARWASTCGGRLDWIWAWLFSTFQRSRHGSSSSASRKPRANDENV
ncbi:hypothetical protein BGX28_007087 [Mortierella sp. GBA30]|nr:hypothetical protein BGX28_007087 [Mortierella sp. GBA30]